MVCLAGNRPEVADLPVEPFFYRHAGALFLRIKSAGLAPEVLQNRARLEHRDRLAVRSSRVDDGRDAVVGRDRQKVRFELRALGDVHRNDIVGQPAFFQHDGNLPAVRRRPEVEIDGLGLDLRHQGSVPRDRPEKTSACCGDLIGSVGEMIENRCRSAKINFVAAPYGVCRTVLRRVTPPLHRCCP
jgi:hypothetical protein